MNCQILRSCTKWSNGTPTEKSIQTAYIDVIEKSQHFVYIENQFFITATGDKQKPVKNLIGKALVDRILRAARNGEKYKVIVLIPSVPAFAGDLRDDASLGTRAIMEFQYFSINRGGHSIMELIAQAGFNPVDYIRFYNLRNYDRINAGQLMSQVQQQSGVSYEDARKQHDDMVGAGYVPAGEGTSAGPGVPGSQYQQYQATAQQYSKGTAGRWDTVAECYMLGGQDIRNVPWSGSPESELDAFVSEELYIHSKCLIADDRVVICGSANLNDRSQLGYHDSEIAILIEDPTPVNSMMAGQPWRASQFAASLRRQLFRKHLGLLRPQDITRPDANFEQVGVPNAYDWGSPEDNLVTDPLSDTFLAFWNTRARTNTEVFRKAFRAVPDDEVHTWNDYKEFYEYYFHGADAPAAGKTPAPGDKKPSRVAYGHVWRDDFPGGVRELKELLSRVKGTLVEMPLTFLSSE
jgi:phospholipase D1/2